MKKIILLLLTLSYAANAEWKEVQLPDGIGDHYYLEIFFLEDNPAYGWITSYEGFILRTTDTGATWQGLHLPESFQAEGVHFINPEIGFVSGYEHVYKTIDSGKTWEILYEKDFENFWGIHFFDENKGIVASGSCNGFIYFLTTSDGGQAWEVEALSYANSQLTEVEFIGLQTGYAVSSGALWQSGDGGKNWAFVSETGEKDYHEDLSIYGQSMLVPYSKDCDGTGQGGGMRFSQDKGISWNEFSTEEKMFGSFLADENIGWACGYNRAIYRTKDAGASWIKITEGISSDFNLDDIYFINKDLGFAAGDNKLYKYETIVNKAEEHNPRASFNIYPNPAGDIVNIDIGTASGKQAEIAVYGLLGNRIGLIFNGPAPGGNEIVWDAGGLRPGVYIIRMKAGGESFAEKLIIE